MDLSTFVAVVGLLFMAAGSISTVLASNSGSRPSILGVYGMRVSFIGIWVMLVNVWTTNPYALAHPRPVLIFFVTVVLLGFAGLFDALNANFQRPR
jgi:hypothetical protein